MSIPMDMQTRTVLGKNVKRLRNQGLLPATVYGKGIEPVSVQIDGRTFETLYHQVGHTSLLNLNIPGQQAHSAFIQNVQRHPVTRAIIHAEFRVVNLTEAMQSEVPVIFVGTSPLVELGDAIINPGLSSVIVRSLPAEVPNQIEIDLSKLDSFDKSIYVRDLPKNEHYTVVTDEDTVIVTLSHARRAAEEEEEPEEMMEEVEPSLIRKERETMDEE